MARKRTGKSRSQSVREYLADNPDATPKQIVEALAARGIRLSVGLASHVKYSSGPGARRRRKKVVRRKPGRAAATHQPSINDLVQAKRLADEVGGIEKARKALDALATLQK